MKVFQADNTLKKIPIKDFYKNLFDINTGYFKNPYLLQDPDNKELFFNAITSEYCCLTKEELNNFENNNILEELIDNLFYLTNNLKEQLSIIANNIHKEIMQFLIDESTTNLNIVILTTTGCNASCFYCYQHNLTKEDISIMNIDTANNIINFITQYQKNRTTNVHIRWFGGEPLLNKNIISYICNKLYSLGIIFSSSIISNTLLFNEETIKEMQENHWYLKHVQVALDGTEKIHNQIKNFKDNTKNGFQIILHNISLLVKAKVKVSIRLNVSPYNKEDLIQLINYLNENNYLKTDYITTYCATLFRELGEEGKICNSDILKKQLLNNFKEVVQYLNKYNCQILDAEPHRFIGCKTSLGKNLIILPNGSVSSCEHYNEILPFMNIENINFDIFQEYSINRNSLLHKHIMKKKCQYCWKYPFCSFVFSCGANDGFCNKYVKEKQEFLIIQNLRNLYKKEN